MARGIKDDLAGKKFGHWTVVGSAPSKKSNAYWYCVCSCGAQGHVSATALKRFKYAAALNDCSGKRHKKLGARTGPTIGPNASSVYGAIRRCHNPSDVGWANYGGRGIAVCERWRKYPHEFAAYLGLRPSLGHSIDRINNDGNYEPGNVRWATGSEQARNRRSNRLVTIDGKTDTLVAWLERIGISKETVRRRMRHGMSIEGALTAPAKIGK